MLQLLRLSNAADTIVGDGMTRGCSGGEKRRVTTGEYVVGPIPPVLAFASQQSLGGSGTGVQELVTNAFPRDGSS